MIAVINLDADRPLLPAPRRSAEPDELRDDLAVDLPGPREVYRWAIQRGWSEEAAGNWAAFVAGVPIVDGENLLGRAWRVREIEHLEFLRAIVGSGRLAGDTAADR